MQHNSEVQNFFRGKCALGALAFYLLFPQIAVYSQVEELPVYIDYYVDGGDTIFVEYPDSSDMMLRMPPSPDQVTIGVSPSATVGDVQEGLYGIHVGGMFTPKHMPQSHFGEDQWALLADMRPEVLRFPSGSNSTFMHLLHHPTLDSDSNGIRDRSIGYGYVAEEIIRYYDFSDGVIDLPVLDVVILDSILSVTSVSDAISEWVTPATGWIDDETLAGDCFSFLQEYKDERLLSSEERYIDDFIALVQQLETSNEPGYRVKVIVTLNIASETAEECRAIVEYLRDNDIYDVEVYGVEFGNECYNRFYSDVMGFSGFADYYRYLWGDTVPGVDINALLRPDMQDDGHNFVQTFKGDSAFDCRVAVTANDDPGNETDYALRIIDAEWLPDANWNDSIAQFYQDTVHVAGLAEPNPAFDAVVIHPYYATNNYKDAMLDSIAPLLAATYVCDTTTSDTTWRFSPIDTRLDTAFDFMSAKYISLFRTEFKESFDRWGIDLLFTEPELFNKEIWLTEWNFKDKGNGIILENQNRMEVYSNTFLQGAMVFEWNLKHLKMNFQAAYAHNFVQIACLHNYGTGDVASVLHVASGQELQYFDTLPLPWMTLDLCNDSLWLPGSHTGRRNYFIPGTPYFSENLIRTIYAHDLKYVKTNYSILAAYLADNLQPTVFISPGYDTLYLVFSNIRGHMQNYFINPYGLLPLYPAGASDITFGTREAMYVQADATCSTAGYNSLYELNTCYSPKNAPDSCNMAPVETPFPMDILGYQDSVYTPNCPGSLPANRCVTVPPYSYGIIKMPIEVIMGGKGSGVLPQTISLQLFPNPANASIIIQLVNSEHDMQEVCLYNAIGMTVMCASNDADSGMQIDITALPAGVYFVDTRTTSNERIIGKFIKQ